ncbi:MAG: hypothetical protein BGO63_08025 [Candidatus Accumulibacter sp. 66-26]|nr:hypothetical protein [Accumulibacter sp.]OJW49235.1 MAG: hypothetical protein BGO63_08025 [Candidatus Accumulibacter sp. 66-26]
MHKPLWPLLLVSLTLGACATVPTGPSVMVLPGTGKPFEQFRGDETVCRQFALQQVGGATAQQNANDSAVTSAAVGTLVGAAAGAAIGGRGGAAVGAGGGLLVGSAAGADASQRSAYGTQRQYDIAFIQCMYAHGHRVPVPAGMAAPNASSAPAGGTRSGSAPPPPSGMPPPPPPR